LSVTLLTANFSP